MLSHVLVPVDGSSLSEKALDYARQIVDPNGRLTLVTVVDIPISRFVYPSEMMPAPVNTSGIIQEIESESSRIQQDAMTYVRHLADSLRTGNLRIETFTAVGEPAQEILNLTEKEKPDAIVMATHGRTGLSRWFLGSVTQRVLSASPVPVLVIPARQSKEAGQASPA